MNLKSRIFQRRTVSLLLIVLAAGLLVLVIYQNSGQARPAAPQDTGVAEGSLASATAKNLFRSVFSGQSTTPAETAPQSRQATGTPASPSTQEYTASTETPTVVLPSPQGGSIADSGGMFYFPPDEALAGPATATLYVIYYTPLPTWTLAPSPTLPNTPTPKPTSTLKYPPTATFTPTPTATLSLPDTGAFAFLSPGADENTGQVRLYDFARQESSTLAELTNVELCNWSPSGKRLLIQVKREGAEVYDLQLLALDGTLTTVTGGLAGSSLCGDWLPDGSAILFPYINESGNVSLSSWTLATNTRQELYASGEMVSQPDVSPDGRWVVFAASSGGNRHLVLLDLFNHNAERLTFSDADEDSPRFSANSQSVLFARMGDRSWDLYSVKLATKVETCLSNNPANELWPDESAAGLGLLFGSDASGVMNLYLLPQGASVPMVVMPEEVMQSHPLWRP